MAKAKYCEKCGQVYCPFFLCRKCNFCKTKLKVFPEEMEQKYKIFDDSWMDIWAQLVSYTNLSAVCTVNEELSLREELIARTDNFVMHELADSPQFSPGLHARQVQKRRELDRKFAESTYRRSCEKFAKSLARTQAGGGQGGYVPRCPVCGSADIQKIAFGTRAVKTAAFGVAGAVDDAGKTYKCGNCGSKF
ncbi:MAG: hypothetical protein HFH36_08915 [Lachnospiraceae bacterium]|nr:hypothetical protein [Lachnospiraceae bacterium]